MRAGNRAPEAIRIVRPATHLGSQQQARQRAARASAVCECAGGIRGQRKRVKPARAPAKPREAPCTHQGAAKRPVRSPGRADSRALRLAHRPDCARRRQAYPAPRGFVPMDRIRTTSERENCLRSSLRASSNGALSAATRGVSWNGLQEPSDCPGRQSMIVSSLGRRRGKRAVTIASDL